MGYSHYDTYFNRERLKYGYTLREIAECVGLTNGQLSNYFNGLFTKLPSKSVLAGLASFFDITEDECVRHLWETRSLYLSQNNKEAVLTDDADYWWANKLKENKISLNEFCKQVGVSGASFRDWTRKKYRPNSASIAKICEVFNVTEEELEPHIKPGNSTAKIKDAWWDKQLEKNSLSKAEFCNMLEITPECLAYWATKKHRPNSQKTILKICEILHITEKELEAHLVEPKGKKNRDNNNNKLSDTKISDNYVWWTDKLAAVKLTEQDIADVLTRDIEDVRHWFKNNTRPKKTEISTLSTFLEISEEEIEAHLRKAPEENKTFKQPGIPDVPIVKETPVIEETPVVEETPVIEEVPTVEETPIIEEVSTVAETPIIEEVSTVAESEPEVIPVKTEETSEVTLIGLNLKIAELIYGKVPWEFFIDSADKTLNEVLDVLFKNLDREPYEEIAMEIRRLWISQN